MYMKIKSSQWQKMFYHGPQDEERALFCAEKSEMGDYVSIKFRDNDGDRAKARLARLLSVSVLQALQAPAHCCKIFVFRLCACVVSMRVTRRQVILGHGVVNFSHWQ